MIIKNTGETRPGGGGTVIETQKLPPKGGQRMPKKTNNSSSSSGVSKKLVPMTDGGYSKGYRPTNGGSGGGGNGGGAGGGSSDYVPASGPSASDLLAQMMNQYREQQRQAAQAAMDAANKQIDLSLSNALTDYANQRKTATADYQTAINNSELNRFWAGKNLRETQANRGLLDSGAGRQDRLFMDSNYNNNLTKILTERAKAYADIENAINTAKQNAAVAKANNYSNYLASNASAMSSLLPALLEGYSGDVSTLTSALAAFNQMPTATVQNAAETTSPTVANILAAYEDQTGYNKKKNTNYVY